MRGIVRRFVLALCIAILLPACNGGDEISRLSSPDVSFASGHASCRGDRQSPINLSDASTQPRQTLLRTSYRTAEAHIVEVDRGAKIEIDGGTLTIEKHTYSLQRVEVRSPSEHTIEGTRYAAELQLVHQTGSDRRAILSIPIAERTRKHDGLDQWLRENGSSFNYNVGRFLPTRRSYYTYDGSLTRPPCRENVRWVVMDTPVRASPAQVKRLREQYAQPARPLQARKNRSLVHVAP